MNSGNFNDIAQNYDGSGSVLSDVRAYPNSISPFGSFDMGGDVYQWNDSVVAGSDETRGGDWGGVPGSSGSSIRFSNAIVDIVDYMGFRVASVPEPSTGVLAVLACGLMWWKRKSFTRVA
jgi:sulfatase modifying factor 1